MYNRSVRPDWKLWKCDRYWRLFCYSDSLSCWYGYTPEVLQCKCLRIATGAPWYISNRQIHEDLGVPFFADHIRVLTDSFDSKLADAGNTLVRQLGRYLTEDWPKSPEAQAKGGDGQQTGRGRPSNGHQVDQTNRVQQSSVRRFSATPTEILPWFSSAVRRMPGYNFMQRRGTARNPPQAQRPHQSVRIMVCEKLVYG
jgi:hypothetical protein